MSSYDRRTWQRPPGERTADPLWVNDVEDATGRRGTYRIPSVARHGDCPIQGSVGRQYTTTLLPRHTDTDDCRAAQPAIMAAD